MAMDDSGRTRGNRVRAGSEALPIQASEVGGFVEMQC
jgi:hypothetical protein